MAPQPQQSQLASPEDIREVIDLISARQLAERPLTSHGYGVPLREVAGLSQEALGERIGVHKSTVFRWETGKRNPNDRRYLSILISLEEQFLARLEFGLWWAGLTEEERMIEFEAIVEELRAERSGA